MAVRSQAFNLAKEFVPKQRYWREVTGLKVSDAKLFVQRYQKLEILKPAGFRRKFRS